MEIESTGFRPSCQQKNERGSTFWKNILARVGNQKYGELPGGLSLTRTHKISAVRLFLLDALHLHLLRAAEVLWVRARVRNTTKSSSTWMRFSQTIQ